MKPRNIATLCVVFLCVAIYSLTGIPNIDAGKVMVKSSGGPASTTTTAEATTTTSEPTTTTSAASTTTTTAACSTVEDSDTTPRETPANVAVAAGSSYVYSATRYQVDSSYTLCALDLSMQKVVGDSSPTWNIKGEIWSDDAGNGRPDSLLQASSNTLSASDLDTSYGWEQFTFSGVSLTSGTVYWFVVHATVDGDGGDCVQIQVGNNFTDQERGDSTPSWTDDGNELFMFRTYK